MTLKSSAPCVAGYKGQHNRCHITMGKSFLMQSVSDMADTSLGFVLIAACGTFLG